MAFRLGQEAIVACLPQQPPFCFVDEAELDAKSIRASYTITGDEVFLAGHFRGNPVFPASIVFEALGQAACLWTIQMAPTLAQVSVQSSQMFFTSMESARFFRQAVPGDRLEMEMKLVRLRPPLAIFNGTVGCAGQNVALVERLVLAFAYEESRIQRAAS